MKKLMSILLCVTLIAGLYAVANADGVSDPTSTKSFENAMTDFGISDGNTSQYFSLQEIFDAIKKLEEVLNSYGNDLLEPLKDDIIKALLTIPPQNIPSFFSAILLALLSLQETAEHQIEQPA